MVKRQGIETSRSKQFTGIIKTRSIFKTIHQSNGGAFMVEPAVASSPSQFYSDRFGFFSGRLATVNRSKDFVSNARLIVVIAALVISVLLYRSCHLTASGGVMAAGCIVFVLLALRHAVLFRKAEECEALIHVNRKGMLRSSGEWSTLSDDGAEFTDAEHPYTGDCDIFGKGSLYQHCCAACTFTGRTMLAGLLSGKEMTDAGRVRLRQEAVTELAALPQWRQELEGYGYRLGADTDPHTLVAWGEAAQDGIRSTWYKGVLAVLQTTTLVCTVGAVVKVQLFLFPALCAAAVQLSISAFLAPNHFRMFGVFERQADKLDAYGRMIGHVTGRNFSARLLDEKRDVLCGRDGAALAMKRLAGITAASEARFSPLPWFLANTLLLWDIRCILRLTAWRKRYGKQIADWFSAIGTFEAFSSCATFAFENPDWIVPEVSEAARTLQATGMGHPLIDESSRVCNDLALGPAGERVMVITGSNMSGKSTFLRTIGCNLVLAYAGSPVCAQSFTAGLFSLYTSMRTGDDLLSHKSTFYAELLRVKKIVDAVKESKGLVLYLLDELFRGTNSADRHDGAVQLLDVVAQPHTLGFVATHDLDLCRLADGNALYRNAHFREWYDGNTIRFDYTLREGPSNTRNALFLMRMAGITDGGDCSLRR